MFSYVSVTKTAGGQGVGGSNPLAPTISIYISNTCDAVSGYSGGGVGFCVENDSVRV